MSLKWSSLFLLASLVWGLAAFVVVRHRPDFSDLQHYREAGVKTFLHETVYDVQGHYTFNYPPFAALFYGVVFGQVSFRSASVLYYAGAFALWMFLAWSIFQHTHSVLGGFSSKEDWFVTLAISIFIFAFSLRDELKLGQTTVFAFGPAWLSYWLMQRKKSPLLENSIAGVALAFAVQIKIQFALLLFLLLLRRKSVVLIWFLLGSLCWGVILPLLFHGIDFGLKELQDWFIFTLQASQKLRADQWNVSWVGVLARWMAPLWIQHLVNIALFLLLCVELWRGRKYRLLFEDWAFCLAYIAVLNPIAWPYWTLMGFPLFLLTWRRLTQPQSPRLVGWCLILFGISLQFQTPLVLFYGGVTVGVSLLLFVARWIPRISCISL